VIKNPEAQISRTVCSLKSDHKLVLTGTPIENSLTDLWSQMEFLNPGLLGQLAGFRKIYVNSFDPSRDEQKVARLQKLVAPFILRRRKTDVEPDLPELSIEYRYCEMTDSQQRRYEVEKSAVRNEILAGIENGSIPASSVMVLKALIRLRQTACHPLLIDRGYAGDSGKLDEVMRNLEILREENQKVLIFSSFVEHLKILAERFRENSWGFSMLTGSTQKRETVISGFKDQPDNNFFLISLKAGGTGLNLTEAGYVFMLDPWWNPAAELQAINRAHRIGQDKKVIAYKFISKDSIEEKMLILQQRKQVLSDTFIPLGNPLKDLGPEEVAGLLG
jgi:SNF2 family DNA or RNA helicase